MASHPRHRSGIAPALILGTLFLTAAPPAGSQELLLLIDDIELKRPPASLSADPHTVGIVFYIPPGEANGEPATASLFEGHFEIETTSRAWSFEAPGAAFWPEGCTTHSSDSLASISCVGDNVQGARLVGSFSIGGGGAPLDLRYIEGIAGFDAETGPDWQIPIAIQPSEGSHLVAVPEPDATLSYILGVATLAALSRLRHDSQCRRLGELPRSPAAGPRSGSDARC